MPEIARRAQFAEPLLREATWLQRRHQTLTTVPTPPGASHRQAATSRSSLRAASPSGGSASGTGAR
eukprot:1565322-Pyramimonas_sp.AAC.1